MVQNWIAGEREDYDETRRLLYMTLAVDRTDRYELAGTVVNALVHHHAVEGLDAGEAMDQVISAIRGELPGLTWARGEIDRITGELGS